MIILNQENIIRINRKHNSEIRPMRVYKTHGDKKTVCSVDSDKDLVIRPSMKTSAGKNLSIPPAWENTTAYNNLWDRIRYKMNIVRDTFKTVDNWKRNIEHMPAGAEDLFDLIRLDITLRASEIADLTGILATEMNGADMTDPFYAQWLYEYSAPFESIDGQGEKVNMVYTQLGDKTPIGFDLAGVGFQQDLYNQLFNPIFDMQKVNRAVARGDIWRRNDRVIAPIINFAWPANKIVQAVVTGSSFDDNNYQTIDNAIEALGLLTDFQTKQYNDVSSGLLLMCHSTRVRSLSRAINGRLLNGSEVRNLDALSEISRMLPVNPKSMKYFAETKRYAGCDPDIAYLMIPRERNYVVTKRGLTHKTGPGDAFALESDKEAWYRVDAVFNDHFLGGDTDDPAPSDDPLDDQGTLTQGDGRIVMIHLPPRTSET